MEFFSWIWDTVKLMVQPEVLAGFLTTIGAIGYVLNRFGMLKFSKPSSGNGEDRDALEPPDGITYPRRSCEFAVKQLIDDQMKNQPCQDPSCQNMVRQTSVDLGAVKKDLKELKVAAHTAATMSEVNRGEVEHVREQVKELHRAMTTDIFPKLKETAEKTNYIAGMLSAWERRNGNGK